MSEKKEPKILHKSFSFDVQETKETEKEGQKLGIIKGYASIYNTVDRGNEKVIKGAFTKSLERHRKSNNRPIRMYYQHDRKLLIGGFPIDKVRDDDKGLYVEGEINLAVPEGRSAYALAKQGVLTDLSIGYSELDTEMKDGVYLLKELQLWEVSPVGEPMHPDANIEEVKGVTGFQDYPIADRGIAWDASAADKRVRNFTKATEEPNAKYRSTFMWYDSENADNFTAYKLQYVDVVDGKLQAIPRAIFAIAAVLGGARGGVNIPEADKKKVAAHVNKYYKKIGLDSPLKNVDLKAHYEIFAELLDQYETSTEEVDIKADEIEAFETIKDIENFLKEKCGLSSSIRKILISKIKSFSREVQDGDIDTEQRDVCSKLAEQLSDYQINKKLNDINDLLRGNRNAN
jgi:HK97 family phage prohead protease